MRICLVKLPSPFLINDGHPPLGLMSVGTGLKVRGHDVVIYDGPINSLPLDFEYYGIGPTTPEYPYALRVRELVPSARIVIGGPFATLNYERCMKDGFDCVVVGDGEVVSEAAFLNDSLAMVVADEKPLDEYPIIDRTLVESLSYSYSLDGRKATSMVTSQGCPYKCSFCSKNYTTVRLRSVEHVIKEIGQLLYFYGFNAIVFVDDLFMVDRERVENISYYLREHNIRWRCLTRGDLFVRRGDSFVRKMAESGCVEVAMGIESGSDKILANVNKGEMTWTMKEAIRMLKGHGIRVKGFFVLGLPGESLETIHETDMFIEEMELDDVDIRIYQPYPGSPIYNNRKLFDIDWDDVDLGQMFYKGKPLEYHGSVRTSSLSNSEIVSQWRYLENKYEGQRNNCCS